MKSPSSNIYTRRDFLKKLGALSLLSATPRLLHAAGSDFATVSVYYTTDLHGHILPTTTYEGISNVGGLARCATQIRQWRKENPDSLLLDIGDLYQGTHASHATEGEIMLRSLEQLHYDGWVLGNHDFDWGADIAMERMRSSTVTTLAANVSIAGKKSWCGESNQLVAPYISREIAGFHIGVVGVITPGMTSWLSPELLGDFEFSDPLKPVAAAIAELEAQKVDAIILAGHMGHRWGRDNFANRVSTLCESYRNKVVAFIGGHTHVDVPTSYMHGVLYTQAGYHGIHVGRLDLTFSRGSRQVLDRRARTVWMTDRFEEDPLVLSIAEPHLKKSTRYLDRHITTFTEPLRVERTLDQPSPMQELIAAGIEQSLGKNGEEVTGVFHGSFLREDWPAGKVTPRDLWTILPYENFIVTAELTKREIVKLLEESANRERDDRNMIGLRCEWRGRSDGNYRVREIRHANGRALSDTKRYTIAFNSYDSQSGGQKLPFLAELMQSAKTRRRWHDIQVRDAVLDYLLDQRAAHVVERDKSLLWA